MTDEELIARLAGWIGEINDTAPPAITRETDLMSDLGLDSLGLAELAARVRTTYQVRLRASEVAADLRVGALVDLLKARLPP